MTLRRTFSIEVGRCGWGVNGGLVPEVRLGWVRAWTCAGSVVALMAKMRAALDAAERELRGKR